MGRIVNKSVILNEYKPTIEEFLSQFKSESEADKLEFAYCDGNIHMRVFTELSDKEIRQSNIQRLEKELETLKNNN